MSRLPPDLERLLHDLRGPLNGLAMHAEVLKRAVREPAAAESVRTIQQEVDRLADMLGAAMEIVALEAREWRRVNLRGIVERALDEARLKDVVLAGGVWPDVRADAALLARAAVELVQNAVEATRAAGAGTAAPEVTAEERSDGTAALTVRDFGEGFRSLNPKVLIRLRVPPKEAGREALGFLAVERIARLHGGHLRFESPGVGARVSLILPRPD